jgi:hypothetical protein
MMQVTWYCVTFKEHVSKFEYISGEHLCRLGFLAPGGE